MQQVLPDEGECNHFRAEINAVETTADWDKDVVEPWLFYLGLLCKSTIVDAVVRHGATRRLEVVTKNIKVEAATKRLECEECTAHGKNDDIAE